MIFVKANIKSNLILKIDCSFILTIVYFEIRIRTPVEI